MPTDAAPAPEYEDIVHVTVRGGISPYYSLNFATVGVEGAFRVAGQFHVVAGAEVYVVKRTPPPAIQLATGDYYVWEQIVPISAGGVYEFLTGPVQPYGGADLIVASYYNDSTGSYLSFGARLRGGVDFMVNPHFGLNANVALGTWSGSKWSNVEVGIKPFGLLPQLSAGALVAF